MKRSLQEYVELVVFGLIALLVGTGLLWLLGWVLSLGGVVLKGLAGLLWMLLRFVVPVAIAGGLVYFLVKAAQDRQKPAAAGVGGPTVPAGGAGVMDQAPTGGATSAAQPVSGSVGGAAQAVGSAADDVASDAINAVTEAAQGAGNSVDAAVDEAGTAIEDTATEITDEMADDATSLVSGEDDEDEPKT